MKGIEKVIDKFSVQRAVYWGSPTYDGNGGMTFDAPVEIKCRWRDSNELKLRADGNYYSTKAKILTNSVLVEGGFLWKGTLAELTTLAATDTNVDTTNPVTILNSGVIHQIDITPMPMKNDEFVRVYYLYDFGK